LVWAQGRSDVVEALLVRVTTDTGVDGWGECGGPPAAAEAALAESVAPALLGQDPLQTDTLWARMFQAAGPGARRGAALAALSGLDMALWDLRAHVRHCPASELLGGRLRERIACAATGLYFPECPESERIGRLVREAQGYLDQGYRVITAQLGRGVASDTALVHALRTALPDATLAADAQGAYDKADAVAVGRALDDCGFSALCEPVSPETPELLPGIAMRLGVRLVAGRWEQTRWGAARLLESAAGALSALTPDLTLCGGPGELLRIRALAQARGVNVALRVSGTPLALAAALQVLAGEVRAPARWDAAPPLAEWDVPRGDVWWPAFPGIRLVEDGVATVPTGYGWGITLDPAALARFLVAERIIDV
jgi:D-galactarolactone cycloisomerase